MDDDPAKSRTRTAPVHERGQPLAIGVPIAASVPWPVGVSPDFASTYEFAADDSRTDAAATDESPCLTSRRLLPRVHACREHRRGGPPLRAFRLRLPRSSAE